MSFAGGGCFHCGHNRSAEPTPPVQQSGCPWPRAGRLPCQPSPAQPWRSAHSRTGCPNPATYPLWPVSRPRCARPPRCARITTGVRPSGRGWGCGPHRPSPPGWPARRAAPGSAFPEAAGHQKVGAGGTVLKWARPAVPVVFHLAAQFCAVARADASRTAAPACFPPGR